VKSVNLMDKIDYTILSELTKNSTETFLKIGKRMGISSMTVQKRFERMKKEGIILGTSTMIDLSLIGYKGKAFLFIKYSSNTTPSFKENILQIPNLFLFAEIMGEFDAFAMMMYKDTSEIKQVSDKIRAESCVKQVKVAVTSDTFYPFKEEYLKNVTNLFK
jgi:Lrp/AsnC family leucine-responsive transcriptional regulator